MRTMNDADEAVAEEICTRREFNGQRFREGTFVAICAGQVLGIGATFDEADLLLRQAGIADGDGLICEVTEPVADVIRLIR